MWYRSAWQADPTVTSHDQIIQLHNVIINAPRVHEKHDTTNRPHFDNVSVSKAGAEFPLPAISWAKPSTRKTPSYAENMSTDKGFITLNDGNRVPWLAFGIGTAHYNKDATAVVKLAIDSGVTHLDGAQMYNNEESIAQGVKASGKPRSELFIVTKLHKLAPGETVKDSLRTSLAKLGTDYVDLFLIHIPTPWDKEGTLNQVWKGMEEVKQEGLAKSIGVSNFKVEDLKQVLDGATIVPAVNQIEFHPYVYKSIQPILALGEEHGITTASYGGLTPVVRVPDGPLSPVLETVRSRLEATRGKPVSVGQVLTKWIHQKGAIVVTTSSKEERIKEYLDTINVPDLTDDEIKLIQETGSQLHKRVFLPQLFGE